MAHWSGIGIPKTNAIALEVSYTHTHTPRITLCFLTFLKGRSVRKDSKNNNNLAIALPYRHADAISTLLSLICLQSSAPENNTKSSNDNNKNSIMSAATVDTTTRYYYYQPIITKQPFQHGMVVLPLQQVAMSRMPGLMETGIVIGRLAYC